MTLNQNQADATDIFIDHIDVASLSELNALSKHIEKRIQNAHDHVARAIMKDVKRVIDHQRVKF